MALPIQPVSFSAEPILPVTGQMNRFAPRVLEKVSENFEGFLMKSLGGVNELSLKADQTIVDWRLGNIENIHEVSMALARADLALRLLVQVRNKVVDAYQEIMRMQI